MYTLSYRRSSDLVAPVIQGDLLGIISESDILYKGDFVENPKLPLLQRELKRAIEEANQVSENFGPTSAESLKAWELVDELEAEAAYQEGVKLPDPTAFQQFCDRYPEVLHVRHDQVVANQEAAVPVGVG